MKKKGERKRKENTRKSKIGGKRKKGK